LATLESTEICPLVTPVQSDIAQCPVVEVPHLHPQICAVQPHDDAALHLLPNSKRFPVCLAHGSALGLEINYNCNLAAGWGIAVMHNTKLHFAHKGLKLLRHIQLKYNRAGCLPDYTFGNAGFSGPAPRPTCRAPRQRRGANPRKVSYFIQVCRCICAQLPRWQGVAMSEPRVSPKTTRRSRRFDPAVFFEIEAKGRVIAKHRKNEIIFSQGQAADAVFYIKKGKVKVTVVSKQGKEAVIAILGTDEFVGEGCLTGQSKRLATASTMTECVTMRVAKSEIQRVLRDEPAFSQMFMSHLLLRNAQVEEDLLDQLFNSTEKRLARLLLLLANFGKEGRPEPLIAKISQETLAEMIGTTRSRVSHFMNKFRQSGFIDYNGHLEVHSSLLSVVLADQPRTVKLPS
jgi:CRP-like cAMP-binding protein